jgi:hypothetical protein
MSFINSELQLKPIKDVDKIDDNPIQSYSQKKVTTTLKNISRLVHNLEKSNKPRAHDDDPNLLQEYVNELITKFSGNQYDLSRDLSTIVDAYNSNRFDPEQLESIVEMEQNRSRHILQLASFLDSQVNKLYHAFEAIFDRLESGKSLPEGMKESVSSRLNVLQESVGSMTKIMCASHQDLDHAIDSAEQSIAAAEDVAKIADAVISSEIDVENTNSINKVNTIQQIEKLQNDPILNNIEVKTVLSKTPDIILNEIPHQGSLLRRSSQNRRSFLQPSSESQKSLVDEESQTDEYNSNNNSNNNEQGFPVKPINIIENINTQDVGCKKDTPLSTKSNDSVAINTYREKLSGR